MPPDAVPPEPRSEASIAIERLAKGEAGAADALAPALYDELRRLARSMLASERRDHTLQPTALVHEAYLKLSDQRSTDPENRAAFMGLAATIMRRVLVDHARGKKRLKRGGDARRVTLVDVPADGGTASGEADGPEIEALDAALTTLAELDPRKSRLVELRFFCGLDEKDAAELAGVSRATASREWRMARSWLARELAKRTGDGT